MSNLQKSQGSIWQVAASADPAETNYINIECIVSWDGFDGESSDVDATCLESQAVEVDPGLQDFGSLTLTGFEGRESPGRLHLKAMRSAQETRKFRYIYPGATGAPAQPRIDFEGFVKSASFAGGVNANNTEDVVIRLSGLPQPFPVVAI